MTMALPHLIRPATEFVKQHAPLSRNPPCSRGSWRCRVVHADTTRTRVHVAVGALERDNDGGNVEL
jgi:hypothetical protein